MTLRIGGYGIAYNGDPDAYAQAHVAFGYNAAYMPNISIDNRDEIAAILRAIAAGGPSSTRSPGARDWPRIRRCATRSNG